MSWLTDPYRYEFMQRALIAALCVGVLAPTVGVWIVLRRLAYLGDAMSHSVLAGVAAAVLLGWSVTVGALAAGIVVAALIGVLTAHPRLRQDAAIGVVEVALFAIGIIVISRNSGRIAATLDSFLFGQIVAVSTADVRLNVVLTVAAGATIALVFSDLRHATFDPEHAAIVGVRVGGLRFLLLVLLAVTIVVSIQTVGMLMSVAMLVTPAAAARLVTNRLVVMTLIAIGFGVASVLAGLKMSYHLETAPGATVALASVAVLVVCALATIPKRHHRDHAAAERVSAG